MQYNLHLGPLRSPPRRQAWWTHVLSAIVGAGLFYAAPYILAVFRVVQTFIVNSAGWLIPLGGAVIGLLLSFWSAAASAQAGRGYFWRLSDIENLLRQLDGKIANITQLLQQPKPDPQRVLELSLTAVRQHGEYLDGLVNEQRLTHHEVSEIKGKVAQTLDRVQNLFPESPGSSSSPSATTQNSGPTAARRAT